MLPSPTVAPTTSTHDYSAPLRVWHWGNALLIGGQLATILFLKVIVNPKAALAELQHPAGTTTPTLTAQQGQAAAHVISERVWDWHIGIGLTLAAFWAFWVVMQLTAPAGRRFTARLAEAARQFRLAPPATYADARHALLAKLTYVAFYLGLTIMVVTGLALTWADDVPLLHRIEHPVKEVHNVTMYVIIAFVAVHIAGVVWAELTSDHGLVSRMVSGKDEKSS